MDFNENQPIWNQIYQMICQSIASGKWAEEERIPSVRELAMTLQVNPNTIMRTYEKLTQEEVIANRRGIGYFTLSGAQARTGEMLRAQFFQGQLYQLFIKMDQLGIGIDRIEQMYNLYQKQKNDENKQ
ncbi:MAG: GntR family transcriptional regulator [Alistipes sp.]